jgi:large subunit ribosomal protein L25
VERIELQAEPRTILGKKVRALRREGLVPANVYGHSASLAIQCNAKATAQAVHRAGKTQLIQLVLDGDGPTNVMVKDYQRHPTRGSLLHVDFYRVAAGERMRVDIPIRLVGEAPAVRQQDATILQQTATVSAEALPAELPEAIEVDISGLDEIDASIYVRDLTPPEGVTILTDPEELVVKALAPTLQRELEEEAAAEETAAAEAAEGATAEGEGAATAQDEESGS